MTDIAAESPDAGSDDFDTEFEAAREEQYDPADEQHEGAATPEPEAAPAREPLAPEELDKRYRNTTQALKQEREARRRMEAEIAELRSRATQPPAAVAKPVPETPPDPSTDPIGYIEYLGKQVEQVHKTEAERAQQQAELERQETELNGVRDWGMAQEVEYRAEKPDYDDAALHFAKARLAELEDEGIPKDKLQNTFYNELAGLTRRAKSLGRNPADMVYKLAERRGYKPGGASPAVQKLDQVARGQQQSRSLSSSGGRPASSGSEPTVSSVANLKGAAFDQAFDRLRQAERRRG